MSEARRRQQRIEHGQKIVREAFLGYDTSVTLNANDEGREQWYVAIKRADNQWSSSSGDDLDALVGRLKQELGIR